MRILLLLLLSPSFLFAQSVLQGIVLDSKTKSPLAYTNIAVKGTKRGAITNEDGVFRMMVSLNRDTLLVSYVGYTPRVLPATDVPSNGTILLEKKEMVLEEVTIHATQDYLYDILEKCRRNLMANQAEQVAKVYYGIETQTREQPIELLECYYNGYLQGPVMDKLLLKNGRIGLAELDHYCFLTLNSSKAIVSMDPARRDDRYPAMPLQMSRREMRKLFAIEAGTGDADLMLIRFYPKVKEHKDFSGEIWIDRKSGALVRTDFTINHAAKHPFLPLFSMDTISNVDVEVSRTYRQENGATLPDHIIFRYHVTYTSIRNAPDSSNDKSRIITTREIDTKGVVCFYDYGDPFILPYFSYDPDFDDYRKISIIPYNEVFWNNNNTLLLTEKQKENLGFLAREGCMYTYDNRSYGKDFLMDLVVNGKKVFQNYYTFWSPIRRIALNKEVGQADPVAMEKRLKTVLSDLYNLKVQLLLDVTRLNDTLHCTSYTVFDGKESFYQLPEQPCTRAFLNIYFDLCEIERRGMEAELAPASCTAPQIDAIYRRSVERMELQAKTYLKEVKTGTDETALFKWNNYVKEHLGIDNLLLFPLQ